MQLAVHEATKVRVALKIYPHAKIADPIKRKAVQIEILCMQMLTSEFFPKLYATFETDKETVLVQEYVNG